MSQVLHSRRLQSIFKTNGGSLRPAMDLHSTAWPSGQQCASQFLLSWLIEASREHAALMISSPATLTPI